MELIISMKVRKIILVTIFLNPLKKLTKLADSIAVGKMAKDRAKDSLATLEDMKDREINKAIAILSSIKLAYEKGNK